MKKIVKTFVGDFETTVFKGQKSTEVWASACVELFTEDVHVFHSIKEQFDYFASIDCNVVCYYHNLKFDGEFWLAFLISQMGFTQAYTQSDPNDANTIEFMKVRDMPNNSFQYSISSMGMWYRMLIKVHGKIIELRDSYKLLPFKLKRIGQSFKTKHQKLEMEYEGIRYAGCPITKEEEEYIKNDVLVIKEAMEIMFNQGHKKLTIGSCCLSEYQSIIGFKRYQKLFPNIYELNIDENLYGSPNAGEYVRKSYRGGWCYLVKGKENRKYYNGTTADVNSLYPSVMSSESGSLYPVGLPTFWKGDYIPEEAKSPSKYFFIRIKTMFHIKEGMLPFIQMKGNMRYKPTEMLECSDVLDRETGKYVKFIQTVDGEIVPATVTMTMTQTDWYLFQNHYHLMETEILDGCYFDAQLGIFDEYIEKYKKIKLESTGALRELAKLFLNNLYGKMASNTNSSFKVARLEDGVVKYSIVCQNNKKPGYIPVGSAITSYARNFTITAAQMNYHGVDNPGFIYADTDSIHCDLMPDDLVGVIEHPKDFCCWKFESCWDEALFVRQKTYIEHITHENR
ncbi:MAG: hypothetical protein IKE95_08275, partial [Methanobrevibacter sp.]|nr:hypothetical protein [Methanobrevibacter sp.]